MQEFDLTVIGAGPGGYVAAIRAAQLGKKVCVVEEKHLGGVCLNWGCIPTKALLRSAEIFHLAKHAEEFGVTVGTPKANLEKMVARSRSVANQLSKGIQGLLKKNKITTIMGRGSFLDCNTLEITGKNPDKIKSKNFIIATGARARQLPNLNVGKRVWTAKEAMLPSFTPKRLAIVGSGAIGMEFASFYNTIGVKIDVIEMQSRILPNEDHEISQIALSNFQKQGIHFHLNTSAEIVENKDHVEVKIKGEKQPLKVDAVIIAIGVVANTENLGLEKAKVKLGQNAIEINPFFQTSQANIYAIGDVAGGPWLAHKASHEGILAAEHICGKNIKPLDKTAIPGCTYTHPQVASIGITEKQAQDAKREIKVGRFPFMANGKAIALGDTNGLVKVIFCAKTGELLGAHMIGAEVTEMIQGFAIGKTLETTEAELMHTIFPHPTLSEMMHEAVLNAYDRGLHF